MVFYNYKVVDLVRDVDGDTVDLRLDVGFHLTAVYRFRLLGCNTPERGMPMWAESNLFTTNWFRDRLVTDALVAYTYKTDNFGRWLADIYDQTTGEVLSDDIIAMLAQYGIDGHYYPK